MTTAKYLVETEACDEIFFGSLDAEKKDAIAYVKHEYGLKSNEIKRCVLSPYYKALIVYIKAIRAADHDLNLAALIADKKGYNRAVDFSSQWLEAIDLA